MLNVAVVRSSDDSAIHYVLPALWMTSYFHIMVHWSIWRVNGGRIM